jgi:hypothetical protein
MVQNNEFGMAEWALWADYENNRNTQSEREQASECGRKHVGGEPTGLLILMVVV